MNVNSEATKTAPDGGDKCSRESTIRSFRLSDNPLPLRWLIKSLIGWFFISS